MNYDIIPAGNGNFTFQFNTQEESLDSPHIQCGMKIKAYQEPHNNASFSITLNGENLNVDHINSGIRSLSNADEIMSLISVSSEGDSVRLGFTLPAEETGDFLDDLDMDQLFIPLSQGLEAEIGFSASSDEISSSLNALMQGFFAKCSIDVGQIWKKLLLSIYFDDHNLNPLEWEQSLEWVTDDNVKQVLQIVLRALTLDASGKIKISCPSFDIQEEAPPREMMSQVMRESFNDIAEENPSEEVQRAMREVVGAKELVDVRLELPEVRSLPAFTVVINFKGAQNPLTQEDFEN